MTFVELRRPVQAHTAPHRRACPPQRGGAPEVGVGGLQGLDTFGVGPDHEIGVGPQARDVVEAAHHNPALFLLFEKRGRVVDDRVTLVTERTGTHREH
ncbi:Uncharacterised protein [Mycobacterium tuberculosis]|nr:Uncharacterised protein [Mycobacterium tuberculosis]